MTTGYLKLDSIVRKFFPDGTVPLKSPLPVRGKGREGEPVELYEVDVMALDSETMKEILAWFKKNVSPGESEEDIHVHLLEEGYRIQTKHFSSVPMDLRWFI